MLRGDVKGSAGDPSGRCQGRNTTCTEVDLCTLILGIRTSKRPRTREYIFGRYYCVKRRKTDGGYIKNHTREREN